MNSSFLLLQEKKPNAAGWKAGGGNVPGVPQELLWESCPDSASPQQGHTEPSARFRSIPKCSTPLVSCYCTQWGLASTFASSVLCLPVFLIPKQEVKQQHLSSSLLHWLPMAGCFPSLVLSPDTEPSIPLGTPSNRCLQSYSLSHAWSSCCQQYP